MTSSLLHKIKMKVLDNHFGFKIRKKKYKYFNCRNLCDPIVPVWVDPDNIQYLTGDLNAGPTNVHLDHNNAFSHGDVHMGTIIGGDWDRNEEKFNQLAVFQGIHERYVEGIPWEETYLFKEHKERIEDGYVSYGSDDISEFLNKLKKVDELYDNIDENGYITQKHLNNVPTGEIYVNISRNGELLFNGGGRHRLAIAKILDIEQVPVQILVYHEEYVHLGQKGWDM